VKIMYLAPELVVRGSTAAPARPAAQVGEQDAGETGPAAPVPLRRAASPGRRGVSG
jgi:hypothetical protein